MPSAWSRTIAAASAMTSTTAALTSIGFGVAKASTKLGFYIVRSVASVAPIPLLDTSLAHLENLSLLPILLGESIASTSLAAALTSLDLISNVIDAEDEASFSLATFVSLVRREWAEHEAAGRSVTTVARAVAAWAAIQGFTKQWSEDRWLKSVRELKPEDFRPPERQRPRAQTQRSRRRAISRVSVTDDVIMFGRSGQIVSADIGEKDDIMVNSGSSGDASPASSLGLRRSNFETQKTLRRLSKMVLAGYGGAGLLFFGVPLQPDCHASTAQPSTPNDISQDAPRTDTEVKNSEEDTLVHAVEGAEAEAMSPSMRNLILEEEEQVEKFQNTSPSTPIAINTDPVPEPISSSAYSWWNVLLGKHDREIFEGFAFTPADDVDRSSIRSAIAPSSALPSPAHSTFRSFSRRDSSAYHDTSMSGHQDVPLKQPETQPSTAMIGALSKMPRFWVLTDHGRRQVVLVVRGTMSYHELAADLQCEPETFEPATATSPPMTKPAPDTQDPQKADGDDVSEAPRNETLNGPGIPFPTLEGDAESVPGMLRYTHPPSPLPKRSQATAARPSLRRKTSIFDKAAEAARASSPTGGLAEEERYQVHSGILQLARAMGAKGKPVHEAVCAALARNRNYELVLCGHSLGAGIASLLSLMWSDPLTCHTVPSSGLPSNRRVSVYCLAPPCIMSPALSRLCETLITSIVYSFDVVSRLSLGSIRDLNLAAYWLCEARGEESTVSVLRRALKGKIGFVGGVADDTEDEKKWFIALRKTLEANMCFAHLFPPGRVWWAVRDKALHPSHQGGESIRKDLRLYEVYRVEDVFRQIEFKGDMLSSHLPHQYDRILTELDI